MFIRHFCTSWPTVRHAGLGTRADPGVQLHGGLFHWHDSRAVTCTSCCVIIGYVWRYSTEPGPTAFGSLNCRYAASKTVWPAT